MKKLTSLCLLLSFSATAYADGSPWVPDDGSFNLDLSYTRSSTQDFFIGSTSTDLFDTLEAEFVWLKFTYGYDDVWAFDVRTGYAEVTFGQNPLDQTDIADTSFGATYQFINEFEADNGLPTISGRFGVTIGGDYETDLIDAIGDGASGVDLSLLVGKSLTPAWSVFGDLTFRQRDSGVADGVRYQFGGSYNTPVPSLSFLLSVAGARTDSNIDIGGPGFGVDQFSQTDRDADLIIAGVKSGTNIADADTAAFNIGYSF